MYSNFFACLTHTNIFFIVLFVHAFSSISLFMQIFWCSLFWAFVYPYSIRFLLFLFKIKNFDELSVYIWHNFVWHNNVYKKYLMNNKSPRFAKLERVANPTNFTSCSSKLAAVKVQPALICSLTQTHMRFVSFFGVHVLSY